MKILCDVCLHIMRECIHTRSGSYEWWQVHRQGWISKHDLSKQFWREENSFSMRIVFRNDCTATHFAAGAAGSWYGDKIRNFFRHILITSNKIIIVKQVTVMIDTKCNRSCNIHRCTATNSNDTIPVGGFINVSTA